MEICGDVGKEGVVGDLVVVRYDCVVDFCCDLMVVGVGDVC